MGTQEEMELRQRTTAPLIDSTITTAVSGIDLTREADRARRLRASRQSIDHTGDDTVTFGKYGDVIFQVPRTHSVLSTLWTATRYNLFVKMTVFLVMAQLVLLVFGRVPSSVWLINFIFWRLAYNIGLGYLLREQSNRDQFVQWYQLASQKWSWFSSLMKREFTQSMNTDYDYDKVPDAFNAWLLFRGLVDLILVNDFVSYSCFAWQHMDLSFASWTTFLDLLRVLGGLLLIAFNLWVKMDAHRVVKDYAWYWGDFFFQVEMSLTFDGVFEMAPHPMYSVGYAFYYGISLITKSYTVLFVSLAAHIMQLTFLVLVENPHIDKIYTKPATERRPISPIQKARKEILFTGHGAYFRRDLIVFRNFDLFRATDSLTVLLLGVTIIYALIMPASPYFYMAQCVFWRFVHTVLLGKILQWQSESKWWTRHFIKQGGSQRDAFDSWKTIYNATLCLMHVSYAICTARLYVVPSDWTYGTVLLRHTIGVLLVGLQMWTSLSVYEALSEFGWFYGDFFIDEVPNTLYYTGIYRFVNNPEKIMGHAGYWGQALIAYDVRMFALAAVAQIAGMWFLQKVEKPHMDRLYGDQVRQEDGAWRSVKQKVEPLRIVKEVKRVRERVLSVVDPIKMAAVAVAADVKTPNLQEMVQDIAQETSRVLDATAAKLRHEMDDVRHLNLSSFSVKVQCNVYALGAPISIEWRAPPSHSKEDWIGLYRVGDNVSQAVTTVSSRDKWLQVPVDADHGILVFQGTAIPWQSGRYEARYHYRNKYTVLALSEPFEIQVEQLSLRLELSGDDISKDLFLYWQRLFSVRGTSIVDQLTLDSDFFTVPLLGTQRLAESLVQAIEERFAVEFTWQVVTLFPTIRLLSKQIVEARRALAPTRSRSASRHDE